MKKIISLVLAVLMLVAVVPLVVSGVASNDYTQWKQGDSEWNQCAAWPSNEYPGAIYNYMRDGGCVVTSIAMLLRHHNVIVGGVDKFNPWICNEQLKAGKAFNTAADITWAYVTNVYPNFEFVGISAYSLSKITELYNQGYACIINANGGHYVAFKDVIGTTVNIMDPGYSNRPTLASYSNPSEIIYYKVTPAKTEIEIGDRVEFNGHHYQVFNESLNWFEAKAKCEELGGHLVTITSKEEQEFINRLLVEKTKSNYWAGATDEEEEGQWKWITGEEFKYMNWNINEPNNTEYFKGEFENYLHISTSVNNMWNDSYFDAGERVYGGFGVDCFGFICEWDSSIDSPCKHINSVNKPQLDPNCIDIGFTAGVYCNDCETWISGHEVIAVSDHNDANKDGRCDTCMKQLSSASTPNKPETPKKNIIQIIVDGVKTVVNNVVNFFKKLFGR